MLLFGCCFFFCADMWPTVRLVNGNQKHPAEGRVEIFHNGEWGTLVARPWNLNSGTVICHQLGFGSALATSYLYTYYSYYHHETPDYGQRPSGMPRFRWYFRCTGSEVQINKCPRYECSYCHYDVGVKCGTFSYFGPPNIVP